MQEILDDECSASRPGLSAQQLAQLAPPGSTVQDQLDALARMHERMRLGKPSLAKHFPMDPVLASKESYKQDLNVHR